ncbi:Serine protease inhibitor [Nesidiocoris tenuis]|uniref:Serine protease inhibitor n=1 Tax=Nesidiocoris tenuis TaxID=355587 RepID=A0ABN7A5P5_9HEMI|nr:Serine protease inhibitor [Nesidiocoris tenuis]
MKIFVCAALLAFFALASARNWRQLQRSNFIADGSNEVAVNVLQGLSLEKKNAVFSPLGYNTILAILTEGARGNTRNQLVSALKLPEDTYAVRSTFKRVLSAMTERGVLNKPEFRNWFYVYKNYTVEESFRNVLRDNYLIDIKTVDRVTYEEDEATSAVPSAGEETTEELASISSTTEKDDSSEEDNSEEKGTESKGKDSKEKISKEKDSKEDESHEDESGEQKQPLVKKPSNVMKIKTKEEITKVQDSVESENIKETVDTDTQEAQESPISEKEKLPEDVQKEETVQQAQESEQSAQQESEQVSTISPSSAIETTENERIKREVNFLSVNNISSMENERETGLKKISRMLVFNALYFKGNWSTPFSPNSEKRPFKVSPTEEVMVDMIHAEDEFEVGRVPDLDAWAIDLPYQGDRYSLMILVPAADDGLDGLLKRLPGFSFYNVDKHLTKLRTKVCIPKLGFHTISKPKSSFIKSGINDLFNTDADLSGISGSKGLYLEELVQLVQFDINPTDSSYNYLTTSQVSDLRVTGTNFSADQPFIFFLRDKVEDLNIVAGIVYNPNMPSEF